MDKVEKWEYVNNYPNYKISSLGRVKSLERLRKIGKIYYLQKEKILKPDILTTGYFYVNISNNNKAKKFTIHRLVAQAFIPNPENKPQVNHKDGDKLNNEINNLEWCTASENIKHSFDVLGQKPTLNKHRQKSIVAIKNDLLCVLEFDGIREAARFLNMPYQAIQRILKKKRLTYFGWRFEIINDPNFISKSGLIY
jgi:hypothetical protein